MYVVTYCLHNVHFPVKKFDFRISSVGKTSKDFFLLCTHKSNQLEGREGGKSL